jgi:NAD(P)H-hydrate epimerase
MARICDCSIGEVKESPVSILQKTCRELSAHIVLKGAHSLVGAPDGRVYINTTGNSGMASAGSGDVLCGAIAAMYGLGLTIEEAVRTGVFVHGMAGDLAADHRGPDGVTAPDILQHLPEAVTAYRANYLQITEDYYGTLKVV